VIPRSVQRITGLAMMNAMREPSHPMFLLLVGWLGSRVLLGPLAVVRVGPFLLLPAFLVAVLWVLDLPRRLEDVRPGAGSFWVGAGVVADSVFFWVARSGTGSPVAAASAWDTVVLAGSVGCLLSVVVLWALIRGIGSLTGAASSRPALLHRLACGVGALGAVAMCRALYHLNYQVPNEQRSLFVAGNEIHHAYSGLAGLVVLGALLDTGCIGRGVVVHAFAGVLCGMVLDQALYVPQVELSDVAYGNGWSWVGAIAGCSAFIVQLVYRHQRVRETPW
jgi:hypothetical protein